MRGHVGTQHCADGRLVALAVLFELIGDVAIDAHVQVGLGLREFDRQVLPIGHYARLVRV